MSLRHASLEVTYRNGRPVAAYYHLPRAADRKPHRSQPLGNGLVADFDDHGDVVGIEITAPASLTLEAFNEALAGLQLQAVGGAELAPLRAAA